MDTTEEYGDLLAYRSFVPAEALEALAEFAGIAIYTISLATGEIQLNLTTMKLTGYGPGELPKTAETKLMLTFEDDRPIVEEAMGLLTSGKADRSYIEYRMRRKDGTLVSVGENLIVLERDEDGAPARICGMTRDLTRLRWAEEEARRIEKESKRFIERSSYSAIAERNRMLHAANRAASLIVGGHPQDYETALRHALKVLADSVEADRAYILRNAPADGGPGFYTRAIWDKDSLPDSSDEAGAVSYKDYYPEWEKDFNDHFSIRARAGDLPPALREAAERTGALSVMFVPLFLQGDFFGVIGFEDRAAGRLFTEDEADIMRAGALIIAGSIARNETLQQLNKAREEALSGTRAKSEFLSRMSHEIRTPINAIIGMTTLAKKSKDRDGIDYYLDMIDVSSKQLLGLINDILDISKIDAGKLEIQDEPFDFRDMLDAVVQMVKIKAIEKHQLLLVRTDADLSREMIGDSLRLSQVILNLLNNATKFTPDEGVITLRVAEKKKPDPDGSGEAIPWLRISVSDTGIGIDPENRAFLFQVFEQADGSITRNYGGSGLGLSICKKLVDMMGGEIWFDSEVGKGSDFIFEIPVKWGKKTMLAKAEADDEALSESETPDFSNYTIMLAEDIDINREIAAGMLEDTGVNLVFAADGAEAVELYRSDPGRFDLILMDVQMPGMDGLTATRLIRRSGDPASASIPILAMTANAFIEDINACIDAGMNKHIAKPIDIDELIRSLRQYLP